LSEEKLERTADGAIESASGEEGNTAEQTPDSELVAPEG
jgi:hypothetical protein